MADVNATTDALKAEEEKKEKDKEKFDTSVKSIKNGFNDAYYAMLSAQKLIAESFVINGVSFDNNKVNNIVGSIK